MEKKEIPSSDAETDRMEGMDDRESDLAMMSENDRGKKRDHADSESSEELESADSANKKSKLIKETDIVDHIDAEEEEEEVDEEPEEEMEDDPAANEAIVDTEVNEETEEDKRRKEEEAKNEAIRLKAMNGLKEIEINFAKLKDKLYETQLTKLEFELKLCEDNKHPELLEYMKLIDEDFQKKSTRLINLQKYRFKCLDNQTRATRVAIHQQFMKLCQDIKTKEIVDITTNWYDVNKERRTMDMQNLELPEYYQFNKSINSYNINEYMPNLVSQRNATYKELGRLQGLIHYRQIFPSTLNNLTSCTKEEIESDLKAMGIVSNNNSSSNKK
ncbi:hypothetical protein CANINC_000435 [Pichia inconspicua]|uniref:Transcriptional regulatory protein DEP1 n=1 Tax=Pichia inconspicua TaxID=52247 RepID=A0A4T0X6A6_9ASCO|nr:hypothetical protein CANINC_000435 [[Candida] inconspicua]